jgi:hypothetical protein
VRVSGSSSEVRVAARRRQLVVGRPLEFDPEADAVSALEYVLAAVGAEIVGGLRAFAKRRRIALDDVEAIVVGEVTDPLAYFEVVGEHGTPRIRRIDAKVFVASPSDDSTVRRMFEEMLDRLPLVATLRQATELEVRLALTA